MKALLFLAIVGFLSACGKTPSLRISEPASPPPVQSSLTGTWELHMNIANETLQIEEANGVISGVRNIDPRFHGVICSVKGLRVDSKVEFTTTNDGAGFGYTGTLKGPDDIAGEVVVTTERASGTSLWTAHRISHNVDNLAELIHLAEGKKQ